MGIGSSDSTLLEGVLYGQGAANCHMAALTENHLLDDAWKAPAYPRVPDNKTSAWCCSIIMLRSPDQNLECLLKVSLQGHPIIKLEIFQTPKTLFYKPMKLQPQTPKHLNPTPQSLRATRRPLQRRGRSPESPGDKPGISGFRV